MSKLLLDTRRCGLGDVVAAAWVTEGLRRHRGVRYRYICGKPGRHSLARMLGQPYTEQGETDAVLGAGSDFCFEAYKQEMEEGGDRLSVWARWMAERAGVEPAPIERPRLILPPADRREGHEQTPPTQVILFPRANVGARQWPVGYWLDLAWMLAETIGQSNVLCAFRNEGELDNRFPTWIYGFSLPRVLARLERCALVLANDSFGAWAASCTGTPCLALMGPTARVFTGIPNVTEVVADMSCAGCKWQAARGYRASCDHGCSALLQIRPDHVARLAMRRLGRDPGDLIASRCYRLAAPAACLTPTAGGLPLALAAGR